MRQTLFTSYANLPLRNNPEALELFLQILNEHFHFEISGIIEDLINHIIYFAREPNIYYAEGALSSFKKDLYRFLHGESDIAFEAVYGYRDDYCMDFSEQPDGWFECQCASYFPGCHALIDFELFQGPDDRPDRLKCFECEQLYLIGVLNQIIKGKELSEIAGLKAFLKGAINHNNEKVSLFDRDIIGKGLLNEFGNFMQGPDERYPFKHLFNRFIRSIIAYDLGEYLDSDPKNINKIKCCTKCNIIFISETSAKRELNFCGDKCRQHYHNKKRKKEGYYKKYKNYKGYYKY